MVLKENVIGQGLKILEEEEKEDKKVKLAYYVRTVAKYVKIMEDIGFELLYDVEFHNVSNPYYETFGGEERLVQIKEGLFFFPPVKIIDGG